MSSIRPSAFASPWTTGSRWTSSSVRPETLPGVWRKATRFCGRSCRRAKFCMKKLTREWVRKAESDYRGASQLARSRPPVHDLICFCSQQCAEKYFKALVEEQGLAVPRTHDLQDLLELLLPSHPKLATLRRG